MGEQGEDTAQYSIRPPDSAKFRAGAVKVRMQHLGYMLPFSYIYVSHAASYFPTKTMLLGYRFKFSESYEVSTKKH